MAILELNIHQIRFVWFHCSGIKIINVTQTYNHEVSIGSTSCFLHNSLFLKSSLFILFLCHVFSPLFMLKCVLLTDCSDFFLRKILSKLLLFILMSLMGNIFLFYSNEHNFLLITDAVFFTNLFSLILIYTLPFLLHLNLIIFSNLILQVSNN